MNEYRIGDTIRLNMRGQALPRVHAIDQYLATALATMLAARAARLAYPVCPCEDCASVQAVASDEARADTDDTDLSSTDL